MSLYFLLLPFYPVYFVSLKLFARQAGRAFASARSQIIIRKQPLGTGLTFKEKRFTLIKTQRLKQLYRLSKGEALAQKRYENGTKKEWAATQNGLGLTVCNGGFAADSR